MQSTKQLNIGNIKQHVMFTSNKSKVRNSGLLKRELFAGNLAAPGRPQHPYVEQSQFTLSSSHRSLICPSPQPHRGAVLRSFAEDINKPKSLSSKIITIAVFNDKLFLKIILLFTFYGKVCGKRQYHFFPAILE